MKWRLKKEMVYEMKRDIYVLTVEVIFEVSCGFSRLLLNVSSHRQRSTATSIELEWPRARVFESYAFVAVVAELSRQSQIPKCPVV